MASPARRSREFIIIRGYYVVSDAGGTYEPLPDATGPERFVHPGNSETGGAMVTTGTMTGPVGIEVEVLDHPPTAEEVGWEHVEELPLLALGDIISVYESEGEYRGFDVLEVEPGQGYHVRVHARGRASGRKHMTPPDEAVEHHLVQLWPETSEACSPRSATTDLVPLDAHERSAGDAP